MSEASGVGRVVDPDPAPTELVVPMVIRIERADPPIRDDALRAAARGVLLLLTAQRAEWAPAIAEWDGQRIRKVVRRARGAPWRHAAELDGLTITDGSAQLRVYPPIPIDAWPPELAKLQVGGTELVAAEAARTPDPRWPTILLAPGVSMSTGKAMAQAAHAAQLGWRASAPAHRAAWLAAGFPLAVRDADPAGWSAAVAAGAPVVTDGGFTEVEPGTRTALAILPWAGAGPANSAGDQ